MTDHNLTRCAVLRAQIILLERQVAHIQRKISEMEKEHNSLLGDWGTVDQQDIDWATAGREFT